MSLAVIGAGFGRTGTMSLKLALEHLGLGPCYHMRELLAHPAQDPVWHAATRGERVDWDALFEGYESAVDWPVAAFWQQLAQHYLHARFILSVRDSHNWHESVLETIFKALSSTPDAGDSQARTHRAMTRELILHRTFDGRLDDAAHAIAVYERHNQAVRDGISAHRLLVVEAASGWEPLCTFLACPVPDLPYPHSNSREEFHDRRLWKTRLEE